MSKYTTELQNIILSEFDLGMDIYPIFSEEYRTTLNSKIFNHYYFHEIGFETVSRFKHYLNNTMNEIMPYYNKLYQSELLAINPLLSFERKTNAEKDTSNTVVKSLDNTTDQTMHSESVGNVDGTQNTTVDSTRGNDATNTISDKDIFSDTPKALLTDSDITTNLYATDVRIRANTNVVDENEVLNSVEGLVRGEETSSTGDATNTTIVDTDETATSTLNEVNVVTENGFEIPLSELLLKYRSTFLNIDAMIIKDLKDLFLMIY